MSKKKKKRKGRLSKNEIKQRKRDLPFRKRDIVVRITHEKWVGSIYEKSYQYIVRWVSPDGKDMLVDSLDHSMSATVLCKEFSLAT